MCTHLPNSSYGFSTLTSRLGRRVRHGWPGRRRCDGGAAGAGCCCRCRRRRTWWRTWPGSRRPGRGVSAWSGSSVRRLVRTGRTSSWRPNTSTRDGSSASTPGTWRLDRGGGCWTSWARVFASIAVGCRGEAVGGAGSVEADQGVEVDRAAQLVFRDLGVLDGRHLGQPDGRDCQGLGDQPSQRDGEPPPQIRRPPLPHHMRGVVVAVHAQRLPHQHPTSSSSWMAGRSGCGRAGTTVRRRDGSGHRRRDRRGPCRRRVRSGWRTPVGGLRPMVGTVLPPVTPARMRWNMSAAYSLEQDRHWLARRFPQRT